MIKIDFFPWCWFFLCSSCRVALRPNWPTNIDSNRWNSGHEEWEGRPNTFNKTINFNINKNNTFNKNINLNINKNHTFNKNININKNNTFNKNINCNININKKNIVQNNTLLVNYFASCFQFDGI